MIPAHIGWALFVVAAGVAVVIGWREVARLRTRRRDPEDQAKELPCGNFAHPFHDETLSDRRAVVMRKSGR